MTRGEGKEEQDGEAMVDLQYAGKKLPGHLVWNDTDWRYDQVTTTLLATRPGCA